MTVVRDRLGSWDFSVSVPFCAAVRDGTVASSSSSLIVSTRFPRAGFLGGGAGSGWSSSGTGVFRVPLLGVALELDEEFGLFVAAVSVSSVGVGVVRPRVTRVGGGFEEMSGVLRVRRTTLLPVLSVVCDDCGCSWASASAVAARVLRTGSELGTGFLGSYESAKKQVRMVLRTFGTEELTVSSATLLI